MYSVPTTPNHTHIHVPATLTTSTHIHVIANALKCNYRRGYHAPKISIIPHSDRSISGVEATLNLFRIIGNRLATLSFAFEFKFNFKNINNSDLSVKILPGFAAQRYSLSICKCRSSRESQELNKLERSTTVFGIRISSITHNTSTTC